MHSAEINVNVGIGVPLLHGVIHEPPPVVVIPGTYVYFAPNVGVNIFFCHGYWYRPHDGRWYRASGYNGPWHKIRKRRVPMSCGSYRLIFVTVYAIRSKFTIGSLTRIGRSGSETGTGTDAIVGMRYRISGDDKRWERTASQEDGKEKKNDSGRGGKGKHKR